VAQVAEDQVEAIFQAADQDQSGMIELDEFTLMIKSMNPKDDDLFMLEGSPPSSNGLDSPKSPMFSVPFKLNPFGDSEPGTPTSQGPGSAGGSGPQGLPPGA